MPGKKPANPFVGRWRITAMGLWDQEALDLVVPAFVEFDANEIGHFQFIAVQGELDCRVGERGGIPAIEFSWEGDDDGHEQCGRGWGILRDGKLEGRWFVHLGDDSGFVATKDPRPETRRRTLKPR